MISHLTHCIPHLSIPYGSLLTFVFQSFGITFTENDEHIDLKPENLIQESTLLGINLTVVDGLTCFATDLNVEAPTEGEHDPEVGNENENNNDDDDDGMDTGSVNEELAPTTTRESVIEEVSPKRKRKSVVEEVKPVIKGKRKSMRLASRGGETAKPPELVTIEDEDEEAVPAKPETFPMPEPKVPQDPPPVPPTPFSTGYGFAAFGGSQSSSSEIENLMVELRDSLATVISSNTQLASRITVLESTVASLATQLADHKVAMSQSHQEILDTIKTVAFEEVSEDDLNLPTAP